MPTPPELFRRYESGELSREQFHAAMSIHAKELIDEMVEAKRNPVAAYLEQLRNRAAASRLSRKHGASLVREVFTVLGCLPDFPPAQLLWNASHREVPLFCFIRSKHDPLFRVLKFRHGAERVRLVVEYGDASKPVRESFSLVRDRFRRLEIEQRQTLTS